MSEQVDCEDKVFSAGKAYEAAHHDWRAAHAVAVASADQTYKRVFQEELNRLYENRMARGEMPARQNKQKGSRRKHG